MIRWLGIQKGEGKPVLLLAAYQMLVFSAVGVLSNVPPPRAPWTPTWVVVAAIPAAVVCVIAYVLLTRRLGAVAVTCIVTGTWIAGLLVSVMLGARYVSWLMLASVAPVNLLHASALAVSLWDDRAGLRLVPLVLAGGTTGTLVGKVLARADLGLWVGLTLLVLSMGPILSLSGALKGVSPVNHEPSSRGGRPYIVLIALLALASSFLRALEDHRHEAAEVFGAPHFAWDDWILVFLTIVIAGRVVILPRVLRWFGVMGALASVCIVVCVAQGLYAFGVIPHAAIPYLDFGVPALHAIVFEATLIVLFLALDRRSKFLATAVVLGLLVRLGEATGSASVAMAEEVGITFTTIRFGHLFIALACLLAAVSAGRAFQRRCASG